MGEIFNKRNAEQPEIGNGDPLMSFSAEKPVRMSEDKLWMAPEKPTEPVKLRRVVVDYGDWFHTLTVTHPTIEPTEEELQQIYRLLRNWSAEIELDRTGLLPVRGENPQKLA